MNFKATNAPTFMLLGIRGCLMLTELELELLKCNRSIIRSMLEEILTCCSFNCNYLLLIFEDALINI